MAPGSFLIWEPDPDVKLTIPDNVRDVGRHLGEDGDARHLLHPAADVAHLLYTHFFTSQILFVNKCGCNIFFSFCLTNVYHFYFKYFMLLRNAHLPFPFFLTIFENKYSRILFNIGSDSIYFSEVWHPDLF